MAKKCKCPPEGAPAWVVTYGDMMSLLLTFFILLVALSEIKQEEKWRAIVEQVHRAFGKQFGGAKSPTQILKLSQTQNLSRVHNQMPRKKVAAVLDPSMEGRRLRVTQVREGQKYIVGGHVTFEPGSADLSDEGRQQLIGIANEIRGQRTKLEVRGHAGSIELAQQSDFNNLWNLSYARALAVMEYLVGAQGIRAERIRLIASGGEEPIRQRVGSLDPTLAMEGQKPNRRVEVVATEALVREFTKPQADDMNDME